jgi:hypothetical protein
MHSVSQWNLRVFPRIELGRVQWKLLSGVCLPLWVHQLYLCAVPRGYIQLASGWIMHDLQCRHVLAKFRQSFAGLMCVDLSGHNLEPVAGHRWSRGCALVLQAIQLIGDMANRK